MLYNTVLLTFSLWTKHYHGVTIQMKPPCQFFLIVQFLCFHIGQNQMWEVFGRVKGLN